MSQEPPSQVALIIDDEIQIRRLLKISLEAAGYRVFEAADGQTGLAEAAQRRPDIVVLDLGLPDMDGVTVLKRLREWSNVPVVVLSVRDREDDKIAALDHGADDYLTKPFSTGELLARLRVAQRHAQPPLDAAVFKNGRLEVDLTSRTVKAGGKTVKLDRHGVCAAAVVRPPCREGFDAPPDPQGSLGAELRRANPLSARLYGPSAREDRGEPLRARIADHRIRRRLPPDGEVTVKRELSRGK